MRKILPLTRTASIVAIFLMLIMIVSCDEEESSLSSKKDSLLKTWKLTSSGFIQKDGVDVSREYAELSLSFQSKGTYITVNAKELFSDSGTWTADETVSSITLDGDRTIQVLEFSSTTLRILMVLPNNPSGGRGASIGGEYDIQLHTTGN
jgi:hypothetical protein